MRIVILPFCTVFLAFWAAVTAVSDAKLKAIKGASLVPKGARLDVNNLRHHGLVLVPAINYYRRQKRSTDDDNSQPKYRRLAHSVHVHSDIRYRYATTLVTNTVSNPESRAREVFLTVILPDTAFISRFAIKVDGQLFVAFVREKEDAWREYQDAVSQGKTAGHVGISARHSNQFRVSVNTEAKASVTFYLLYEELLQRRRGIYEHVINVTPRQRLKDFAVEVEITENRKLRNISVPELRRHQVALNETQDLKPAEVMMDPIYNGHAKIHYRPNVEPLQRLLKSNHALQFAVRYDVERNDKAGEIQVVDGFFVHFVAPENLPPMPKHVVFVLDTSGSMSGKKILQTRAAMKAILAELRSEDFLTVLNFSDDVSEWELGVAPASARNVAAAMAHVDGLKALGGTNMYDALITGLDVIGSSLKKDVQPMVIFLTDGHATVGVSNTQDILDGVTMINERLRAPIFCLAFGRFADFQLMKMLSLQNNAFARKIYIAADAALQLEGFYKEVSSPVLRDVQFKYQDKEIMSQSLTSTNFHTYYQGSEMVVAGQVPPGFQAANNIQYEIMATQAIGSYHVDGKYERSKPHFYPKTITETVFDAWPVTSGGTVEGVNFLERLWAYLTIKELLEQVAKGKFNSCKDSTNETTTRTVRDNRKNLEAINDDDEDSLESDDGSGWSSEGDDDEENQEPEPEQVEDIMDVVGDDDDIVICDNIERALYLSLKYEFVTPLTSLVVVKPDHQKENGDLSEITGRHKTDVNLQGTAGAATATLCLIASIPHFVLLFYTLQVAII